MHDRELSALITKLNTGRGKQVIVRMPIAQNVDFAKVWTHPQQPGAPPVNTMQPYTFYFLRNTQGRYVSCVNDCHSDLHWYTSRPHRRKGHLKRALAEVIIPHILGRRNDIQITIQTQEIASERASTALARKLGFIPSSSENRAWSYSPDPRPAAMPHPVTPMSGDEIAHWRSQLYHAKESILEAAELLGMHYGERERVHTLREKAHDIGYQASDIADILLHGSAEALDR